MTRSKRSTGRGVGAVLAAAALAMGVAVVDGPAAAGEADVVDVEVTRVGRVGAASIFRFEVTVSHADEGWDHYANAWEVVGPNDVVFGARELMHPHVDEQPFTRTQRVTIPDGVAEVTVRAYDSRHGFGGRTVRVRLPD